MDTKVTTIVVHSTDNPEFNGIFTKENTEADMKELGYELPLSQPWYALILDRAFDGDVPVSVIDILDDERVKSVSFYVDVDLVTVIKN